MPPRTTIQEVPLSRPVNNRGHFFPHVYSMFACGGWIIFAAIIAFVLIWRAPPTNMFQGLASYLPLHTFMETFAVVVAMLIFGIGWNADAKDRPGNYVLLASTFLAVGLLDFGHFMSYAGMPDFVSPSSAQKAINFWLAARFIAAVGLLGAVFMPWRPFAHSYVKFWLLGTSLAFAAIWFWLGLYHEDWLPDTFVAGKGLTPYKVGAEYVIIGIHAVTAVKLANKVRAPQSFDATCLFTAVCIMILSELCFTLYSQVNDIFNLLGHLYKVVAYLLLYRVIFVGSVREPFEELRLSRQNVWQEKERAEVTLGSIGDAVITTDVHARVDYMNGVAEQLSGWKIEDAQGLLLTDLFHLVNEYTREGVENPLEKCLQEGVVVGLANHTTLIRHDGQEFAIEDSAAPIRDRGGAIIGAVMVFHDVSERRNFQLKLHHLAHHDALTNLPNRTLIHDRLEQAMARARRSEQMVAVLFIDLDRFKTINDTLGHDVGDKLLLSVAALLSNCVRESDSVGRLGGDEFMVILAELQKIQDCVTVCQSIIKSFREPFRIDGYELFVTCSVGVSIFPNDGDTEQALIRNADTAMYRAKDVGRNNFQFYTADMNASAFERLALENQLRRALERDELEVYYQPRINITTGRITGAEALVRWRHPQLGLISPVQFIPLAEESGLIVPLGEQVLRAACTQNKAWQDEGFPAFNIAVNLSARQFRESKLISTIRDTLQETGMDPKCLELELTESMLMQNVDSPATLLHQLKDMGIQIAIDDFGTGFSSLSYLKRFPIDHLKIDRSFVKDVISDVNDAGIVTAIIAMGQSLNLKLIAEGVEEREQVEFLRGRGCEEMQGFYFSKPLPAELFTKLLRDQRRWESP